MNDYRIESNRVLIVLYYAGYCFFVLFTDFFISDFSIRI